MTYFTIEAMIIFTTVNVLIETRALFASREIGLFLRGYLVVSYPDYRSTSLVSGNEAIW